MFVNMKLGAAWLGLCLNNTKFDSREWENVQDFVATMDGNATADLSKAICTYVYLIHWECLWDPTS